MRMSEKGSVRFTHRQLPDGELKLRAYIQQVEQELLGAIPDAKWQLTTPVGGEVLSWFSRVRSLFSGIRLLLEAGFPEEAMILARSLFEASLRFELLAAEDEVGRERLVLGEVNAGLARAISIFDAQKVALGLGEGLSLEQQGAIHGRRDQIARRQKRLALGKLARFPDAKSLARRFGRLEEYLAFLLAHETTHGSHLAQATRSKYPASDTIAVYHSNFDLAMLTGVGTFSALAALRALEAVQTIFGFAATRTADLIDEANRLGEFGAAGTE
jgi:Family of unknown function (DUF5677)